MLQYNEPDLISGVSIRSEAIDGTSDVFSTGDDDRGECKCRDHVTPTKLVNEIIGARLTHNICGQTMHIRDIACRVASFNDKYFK